jgi:hypothetical protein
MAVGGLADDRAVCLDARFTGPGNLLPLGVIVFGVLSVPAIIAAQIAAFIATKAVGQKKP